MKIAYYFFLMALFFLVAACGSTTPGDDDTSQLASTASLPLRNSGASTAQRDFTASVPQLVVPTDHGGGFGWKKDKCFLCHSMAELNEAHGYNSTLPASFSRLGEGDTGVCLFCHGTNGLTGVSAETYRCISCHTDSTVVDSAEMFAGHNMHDMNGDGRIENDDCVVCHAFSDMNGEIDIAVDFSRGAVDYANLSDFCLNCHDGNGAFGIIPPELTIEAEANNIFSTYKGVGDNAAVRRQTADIHGARNGSGQSFAEFRGTYAQGTEVACLDCHQAHSSDNPYLITEIGANAKHADETAKAAPVEVTDNNFTQLCAVCHTSTGGAPTDNGLTEVAHPSTYSAHCTDCHYHGSGFDVDRSGLF